MNNDTVDALLVDSRPDSGPCITVAEPGGRPGEDDSILGLFSDVAMMAADWFWAMDADLRFTYQSDRFQAITGIPASEVLGKTREQAFAGRIDDSEKWERIGLALKEQRDYSMVWAIKHADGQIRVLRTRGKPITDEKGQFAGYRGVGSDITEAAIARDKLLASEHRFRNILEHVTDIVCVIDEAGRINFLNSSVENILGYTVAELEAQNMEELSLSAESSRVNRAINEAHEHPGRVVRGVYRYHHKDGSVRVLDMTRKCIDSLSETGALDMVVHARDITDQFNAEQALKHSEERLRDFAETSADWFWEQDAELRFSFLSGHYPGAETGPESSEVIGLTRQEFLKGQNFKSEQWKHLFALQDKRKPFADFEYVFQRNDGNAIVVRINGRPKFNEKGEFTGYRGTGIDITDSHKLSEQLNYQASHDPLTDLVNRREFEQRLARVVKGSRDYGSESALCYIDLDQFKVVNDTCGHDAGDELLRQIAVLLKDKARTRDTIARLGGDEFGLLLEGCSLAQANRVAETVLQGIAGFRFVWAGRSFRLGASIGLIPIDYSSGNTTNVMRSADAACYAAKDAGRNRIHVYHEDNIEVLQRHQEMQRIVDFNAAFDEQRFVLHRQLIQPLIVDGDADGPFYEILVRMLDDSGELVMPGNFLPTAERYNLITQLDSWVVEATLKWLMANPEVRCSINLSGLSLANEKFLPQVLRLLDDNPVDERRICFEITETAIIQNLSRANSFISHLRERGCFFALDDFGSGLSSFAYLKNLSVDFLKIDGIFVRDMLEDRMNYELVKSINGIGHVMGMRTIAEFVEDEQTLMSLQQMGIDYAQGYGIERPVPVDS